MIITTEKKIKDRIICRSGDTVEVVKDLGDVCIVEHSQTKERFSVKKEFLQCSSQSNN